MRRSLVKLGDVGKIYTGSTPKTNDKSLFGGNYPFVTPADLKGSLPIIKTPRTLTDAGVNVSTLIPTGAVLVCCIASLGKIGIAGRPLVTNQQINAIVFDEKKVFPRYGYHACALLKKKLINMAPTTTVPIISKSKFSEIKISLPPLEVQQHIATILDAVNTMLHKRKQAIVKLDELTQNIFTEIFGSTKNNPKKFPTKKLGEIIKFQGGSQPPASTFSGTESNDKIRLVQIRDFRTDKYKTYIPKNLSKRFFESDDVMIGRYGPPVFQIFRGLSGSYNVALMKATPKEKITKDFIFYLLKEHNLHSFVVTNSERTAGQSGVNLDLLENYKAYLPPWELQIKFSEVISVYKKLKDKSQISNLKIKEIFTSLQYQLFS